jgi:hypothetical protein
MSLRHIARSGGKPPYILRPHTRCEYSLRSLYSLLDAKQYKESEAAESTVLASEVEESRLPLIKIGDQTGSWWQEDTETVWRTWSNFTDSLRACYSAMRNSTKVRGNLSPEGQHNFATCTARVYVHFILSTERQIFDIKLDPWSLSFE